MPAVAHRCGGCPARWGGERTCHCSTCHLTFSGLTTFDEHQKGRGGKCLSPRQLKAIGIQEVRPGVLGRPGSTDRGFTGRSRDERGRLS